jgi:hypothetical protein
LTACLEIWSQFCLGDLLNCYEAQRPLYQFLASPWKNKSFLVRFGVFDLGGQDLRDILFAAQGKGGLDALRYWDRGGNRKRVLRDRIKEIKSPRFARVLSVPRRKQFELNFIGHFPLL